MFDRKSFEKEYKSTKRAIKVSGVIWIVIIIVGVIGLFWLGGIIIEAVQQQGLKGIFDSIWNGL